MRITRLASSVRRLANRGGDSRWVHTLRRPHPTSVHQPSMPTRTGINRARAARSQIARASVDPKGMPPAASSPHPPRTGRKQDPPPEPREAPDGRVPDERPPAVTAVGILAGGIRV